MNRRQYLIIMGLGVGLLLLSVSAILHSFEHRGYGQIVVRDKHHFMHFGHAYIHDDLTCPCAAEWRKSVGL